MRAFWDLSTERPSSGTSVGHIPWSRVIQYGRYQGFDRVLVDALWKIISAMDSGFLSWMQQQHKRRVERDKAESKPAGNGRTRSKK